MIFKISFVFVSSGAVKIGFKNQIILIFFNDTKFSIWTQSTLPINAIILFKNFTIY